MKRVSGKGVAATLRRVVVKAIASDLAQLRAVREDIKTVLREKQCHPILIRLGWHDAGTYNKDVKEWPTRGGANGNLHYSIVQNHKANAGLFNAIALLNPVKDKYPDITYADLFQLASATAIEDAGSPIIPSATAATAAATSWARRNPSRKAISPTPTPPSPADHLRTYFY